MKRFFALALLAASLLTGLFAGQAQAQDHTCNCKPVCQCAHPCPCGK